MPQRRTRTDPTMGQTMKVSTLKKLVASGEGPELEFKRSTGELREAMQTLCGFLNTGGGVVLLGVDRKGKLEGQQVSENTIHEITQAFDRFEPPVNVTIERTSVEGDREVVALSVTANQESRLRPSRQHDAQVGSGPLRGVAPRACARATSMGEPPRRWRVIGWAGS